MIVSSINEMLKMYDSSQNIIKNIKISDSFIIMNICVKFEHNSDYFAAYKLTLVYLIDYLTNTLN